MERFDIGQGEFVHHRQRPNLTFEDGSYTLPELLESHLLPVVAQYDSTCQPIPFHEFNFDLSQPLLLYKKRNIQKVVARSLHIEDEKYNEVGESLLIPEDYKGWFAVLQRITGNIKADDTVPHFTTVEEVANSNTDRFLIGGTKKINGLQLLDRSDSQLKHEQRHFLPGDILTREKIYYGETKKRTRLFRKPKYITEKFLMCRDESDREILLPFEQTGIFYQISHKSGKANKQVMQMSDIVARKLTPRIIKLVFGRFPVTPCSFTGLMRAESSKIETSIIASTLINTKNILMEIPVSSAIHFRVAVMTDELRTNACYRSAMSICAERAITYMRNIKVCYNFTMDDEDDENWSRKDFNTDPQSPTVASFINNNNNNTIQTLKTFKQNVEHQNSADSVHDILRTHREKGVEQKHEMRRGFSVDIPDDVTVRPGRCLSAGRVSFCLGNNYLTVPMFEPVFTAKRDSGNNNTIHEKTYTTRRGSRLSFNGTFFEEVEEENGNEDTNKDSGETIDIPPPIPCTNISSYVNIIAPPQITVDAEVPDYIPASGTRRPSTKAPDMPPPPLPMSSSTSGVSSGSLSSVSDETVSKRESSDSFEYAVPKIQDPNTILSDLSQAAKVSNTHVKQEKPLARRPSTFTFSEGCLNQSGKNFNFPACETIGDIDETNSDDGSPIYENIQKLMELVSKLETDRRTVADESPVNGKHENQIRDEAKSEICEKMTTDYEVKETLETDGDKMNIFYRDNDRSLSPLNIDNLESCEWHEENGTEICEISETEKEDQKTVVKTRVRRVGVTEISTDACIGVLCNNVNSEVQTFPNSGLQNDVITVQETKESNVDDNESKDDYREEVSSVSENKVSRDDGYYDEDLQCSKITEHAHIDSNEISLHEHSESKSENIENAPDICRWKIALEKMKNSNEYMSSKGKIREPEKPFHCLDVHEISEELLCIGIKEGTIEHLREMGIDGAKLSEVLDGELSIKDCLGEVNLVDQQKISMFIRGWRPNTE